MKAYKVNFFCTASRAIQVMEVDKITEKSVFINGQRMGRESGVDKWFEDFPSALTYLKWYTSKRLERFKSEIKELEADMEYLSNLHI